VSRLSETYSEILHAGEIRTVRGHSDGIKLRDLAEGKGGVMKGGKKGTCAKEKFC